MAKRRKAKKRTERIQGTTKGEVDELSVFVDPETGEIRFGNDMINVYSEVSYDRPKGPKVLSRIPQAEADITFDTSAALLKNYDFLCAVDTNTRRLRDKTVSVVAVVTFQAVWVPERLGLDRYWQLDVPFCLEYVEIKSKPENFGWMAALRHLEDRGHISSSLRVGVAVDSDLGNLADYNLRRKAVACGEFLPQNVQLVYASGEAGRGNMPNKALALADSVASRCLNVLTSGAVPFNEKLSDNGFFEGYRLVKPNLVRQ